VPAVCEGASCGDDASAKSAAKFGSTSYEYLNRRARRPINLVAATVPGAPLYFGRIAAAAIMKHKYFRPRKIRRKDGRVVIRHALLVRHNGRLLRHIYRGWFGQSCPWRWDQAASCYLDVRIDGKTTNSFDLTWSQAAAGITDETLGNFSTRPYRHEGRKCPLIFYEKWLMAGLDAPLTDFWFFVAELPSQENEPHRYIPSNIYWHHGDTAVKRKFGFAYGNSVGRTVSLPELLSVNLPRLARYHRECWRRVAAANRDKRPVVIRRDKEIMKLWPLVTKKCRDVPKAHRDDAIQACMERLVSVWEQYDPEQGLSFAAQAIDWALQDFMDQLRKQVPVQRSINLNDPADHSDNNDDDDKPPEPEQADMMRVNALQGQVSAARRRLVAERLGCLDMRERRVIEARLAMNGYRDSVRQEALAAELGVDARTIRRIEGMAVQKLQQAVL
jgi:RNA polymerase sigma factor (sigma-70 family)